MATRSLRRAVLLGLTSLILAGCGVLPYTGPPESDFYERADHGHP